MSFTTIEPSGAGNVPAVREAILGGTTDITTLAAAIGRSVRTVERFVIAGMPVIRVGRERRFDLTKAKAWLLANETQHDVPRRGRPTRNRAA